MMREEHTQNTKLWYRKETGKANPQKKLRRETPMQKSWLHEDARPPWKTPIAQ
jgi:hypothetical protein